MPYNTFIVICSYTYTNQIDLSFIESVHISGPIQQMHHTYKHHIFYRNVIKQTLTALYRVIMSFNFDLYFDSMQCKMYTF